MPLDTLFMSLAELAEALDRTPTLEEAADVVVGFAHEHLAADETGLSVHDAVGGVRRLAATSPVFARLDAVGTRLQEGPGVDRMADGTMITVPDTSAGHLWPGWCAAAAAADVRAVRVIALPSLRRSAVTLDLLSARPHAFTADDPLPVSVIRHAGLVLRYVERIANLEDAVESRTLIGQAQGIVMERYSLSPAQAMAFLRRTSQDSQLKVRDLAEDIVASLDHFQDSS